MSKLKPSYMSVTQQRDKNEKYVLYTRK